MRTPVDWLLEEAEVGPDWCLVHATHMTAEETTRLARSGAVAGLCPITEANLGDGLFPAEAFLAAGGRYGVGSDSNVLIDPAEELRTLEYGQRLTRRGRNLLARAPGASTGGNLFRAAALSGGAQALGQPVDGLKTVQRADFVGLDETDPTLSAARRAHGRRLDLRRGQNPACATFTSPAAASSPMAAMSPWTASAPITPKALGTGR